MDNNNENMFTNLANVEGLDNLEMIGKDNVKNDNQEPINNDENMFANLTNVQGLDNLQYIGNYEERPKTR